MLLAACLPASKKGPSAQESRWSGLILYYSESDFPLFCSRGEAQSPTDTGGVRGCLYLGWRMHPWPGDERGAEEFGCSCSRARLRSGADLPPADQVGLWNGFRWGCHKPWRQDKLLHTPHPDRTLSVHWILPPKIPSFLFPGCESSASSSLPLTTSSDQQIAEIPHSPRAVKFWSCFDSIYAPALEPMAQQWQLTQSFTRGTVQRGRSQRQLRLFLDIIVVN